MSKLAFNSRLTLLILFVGPCASLAVSPWTNYDPINLVKLVFVTTCAFAAFGLLVSTNLKATYQENRIMFNVAIGFVLWMCVCFFVSGSPLNQQFWGSFGRNTGFLTYFSLLLLLLSSQLIQNKEFYEKLVKSLIFTAIPMTLYCLIQVAGLDPVGWSEKHPFGTLGNINFSSAFFGLSSICCVTYAFNRKLSIGYRLAILLMALTDLLIVASTGSIQGLMIFIAGIGVIGYLCLRSLQGLKILKFPYLLISLCAIVLTIMGLSNKGPLARLLFAPSIVFRTDYWHAGWKMTTDHPIFGVGLDSYGDFYRQARGLISTLRTGPERISNTAHNIFLDISSNGGFPLLAIYLAINFIALRAAYRVLKANKDIDPTFLAIFCVWIGYLVFSAISINQVGVGIWGWLFTGALIGYEKSLTSETEIPERVDRNKVRSKQGLKNSRKNKQLSPMSGLGMALGSIIGFSLAFIPFNADVKYRSALNSRALDQMIASTRVLGSSAFHSELVLDTAISNNFSKQAKEISDYLIARYPRDYMGWRARWALKESSEEQKSEALAKLKELDPFNPDYK